MAKNSKAKNDDQVIDQNDVLKSDNNTKLDAIKEIIFGQNMREYEEEFNEIRTHINTNLDAVSSEFGKIRKMVDDMEKRINDKIARNHEAIMDRFDTFHKEDYTKTFNSIMSKLESLDEKKADRKKIGKMLSDIGNKLSA